MSSLRFRELKVLEDFLEMGGGYVLNFSTPSLVEFFRDFGIDIDSSPYIDGHSGSKANRMRSFFAQAQDKSVGEVISELIEYAESYRPGHLQTDACRKIAARLLENSRLDEMHAQTNAKPDAPSSLFRTTALPIEIFFSYAHEDEALMDTIRLQLVVGLSRCAADSNQS